ncbi:hypothetical protein V1289_008630 [Bradyrhizobium sp. AZCC 2289]
MDHVTDGGLSATAVFSQPEIGTVGLTEAEARAQFSRVDIYKADFKPIKATMSGCDTRVLMKLVVDGTTDRVLGCHIVGDSTAEITQAVGIAVKMKATFLRDGGAASDGRGRTGNDADADGAACEGSGGGVGGGARSITPASRLSRAGRSELPVSPRKVLALPGGGGLAARYSIPSKSVSRPYAVI